MKLFCPKSELMEIEILDPDASVCITSRKVVEKAEKEVTAEIQAIVRQITASVTFLPLLNDPCAH